MGTILAYVLQLPTKQGKSMDLFDTLIEKAKKLVEEERESLASELASLRDRTRNKKRKIMKEYTLKVYPSGNKYWYLNGKRHREDGPAIEFSDGYKAWYLNGECLTEEEFNKRQVQEMTLEEVCKELGRDIKIVK